MNSCQDGTSFSKIVSDIYINGTWKQTNSGRLNDTDKIILKELEEHRKQDIFKFMDLGASDGITTLDLSRKIQDKTNVTAQYYLADKFNQLIKYKKYGFTEYRTSSNFPVFLKFTGLGIRLPKSEHRLAFFSNIFSSIYLRFSNFRDNMIKISSIPLVIPELTQNEIFKIIEFDCLKPDLPESLFFNCIRASNILNTGYFTESQIKTILSYLKNRIVDGGLLIISRNNDEEDKNMEYISGWKKINNQYVLYTKSNGGTEIDHLVRAC